jgi:hypothetical protein
VTLMVISSITPGLMEISILMVGEMLSMLPSSKSSGSGIGLLNQSICPYGIKYLDSIAYMVSWLGGAKASCERRALGDGADPMSNWGKLIPRGCLHRSRTVENIVDPGGIILVTFIVLLSSGEKVWGLTQGGCVGSLDINQISRYCGLKMVVRRNISMGK